MTLIFVTTKINPSFANLCNDLIFTNELTGINFIMLTLSVITMIEFWVTWAKLQGSVLFICTYLSLFNLVYQPKEHVNYKSNMFHEKKNDIIIKDIQNLTKG